jgi:hypothetical protein
MSFGAHDKPSLSGPLGKVQRAEHHLRSFDGAWQQVIDSDAFTFIHEVNADGVSHRYRAVAVPDLDDRWALVLGDCAHNLRSALDYLVYELVRANGGEPDEHTEFPVHESPGGVRISGAIAEEALQLIEEVQPYTATEEGNRIRAIDVIDRAARRRLVSLVPAATGHSVPVAARSIPAPQIVEVWTSDRPLETGKTVHGYTYGTPYPGEDPSVRVLPHLVLDEPAVEMDFGRVAASLLLGDKLIPWVREQFLPRFEPFF